jgi:hypothetical protein
MPDMLPQKKPSQTRVPLSSWDMEHHILQRSPTFRCRHR